jgi:hypothetical protein
MTSMRWLRILASTIGPGLVVACALAVSTGPVGASATTRLRSGHLHAQFAGHLAPASSPVTAGLSLTGANVTATIVGALALLALAFVVVTLIRRRITS